MAGKSFFHCFQGFLKQKSHIFILNFAIWLVIQLLSFFINWTIEFKGNTIRALCPLARGSLLGDTCPKCTPELLLLKNHDKTLKKSDFNVDKAVLVLVNVFDGFLRKKNIYFQEINFTAF
jgi:hypothetical protein